MQVTARIENMVIPTYEIGAAEKNPVFLEKRVYQGSCGKVYPYPVVEHISDEKKDKVYEAVVLENEYLRVVVLPELGGRIQRAYDKTNGYDFVYYNHVIKPALVGLTGPWISGGIEFNWPQHHRPTTYLPVDYKVEEGEDGSCSVLLHDVDQMYGTKVITAVTLYPGKSYIEIRGQLYNGTPFPQTFLWWANPAVPVNDHTQSVFPPDVHAVMDHGKRDVSRFPVATGVYYKKDYSEGVDISRYKNIPVPTSYMAEKSEYDFVGGYDYQREAGILHVADHHISPGKKQWTWGCGDFGKAWDRNLTDADGPYVELMTGVYTDNQPDFTWLKPFEEKTFTQYFMPYKKVGQVKNASVDAALNLSVEHGSAHLTVYATSVFEGAKITVEARGRELLCEETRLSPNDIYEREFDTAGLAQEELCVTVWDRDRCLVSYQPQAQKIEKLPEPAKAAREPEEIRTNEELYLTGLHIEQYRHATYLPDPYYLEGLKRDKGDIRINNAYGSLLLRRGVYGQAEKHFRAAVERSTRLNPNPYDSEAYYNLGLALWYQKKEKEAFDAFYKASWSSEQQEMAFYYMAACQAREGAYGQALAFIEKALVKNSHNIKARGLKAYLLRKLGRCREAEEQLRENLALDPFDFVSLYEACRMAAGGRKEGSAAPEAARERELLDLLNARMRGFEQNYLMCARDYAQFGAYEEACGVLGLCGKQYPMVYYYLAYYESRRGRRETADQALDRAGQCPPDYCFPNRLEDMEVLEYALGQGGYSGSEEPGAVSEGLRRAAVMAAYYLGNLCYDKLQYTRAVALWEQAAAGTPDFPTVHRNLAIAYFNKKKDEKAAVREMETAFFLDPSDARIFLELDQLHKKTGWSFSKRLENFERFPELAEKRDDLYIEYLTLLNMDGQYEKAYERMSARRFHPWEGGEGKITAQYRIALLSMAKAAIKEENWQKAQELLERALVYPENLGEGKLEGTKDNDIRYYLGMVYDKLGMEEQSRAQLRAALEGTDEPAGMMYYNDQPADMILYQGLAWKQEGSIRSANARFWRLIDFGEQHLEDEVKIDYFAVSLPDLSVFDDDYTRRNHAHCCYLIALGSLGLGDREKAKVYFARALETEPSHTMAHLYLEELEKWQTI